MGQEAICKAKFKSASSEGKALLESDHLLFRGSFRLKIPFKEITTASAEGGILTLATAAGPATFELGPQAEKWARKILNPPSRLDKLGVKPDSQIALAGAFDESFLSELAASGACVIKGKTLADILFYACPQRSALDRVQALSARLKPAGGLWIVYPKSVKQITEMDVLNAGRAAGLKDNKVAGFSATHTALRFVIPLDRR